MAVHRWVVCDARQRIYVDRLEIGSESGPGSSSRWSVEKRTLQGGMQEGVDVIDVDNGAFRFTVLPTRGMSVWRGWYGEREIGWRSPVEGPVHPSYVSLDDPSGAGWLSGFDELLVRCGLHSNGAPEFDEGRLIRPLHGRIANLPAYEVEIQFDDERQEISVHGAVIEHRFGSHRIRLNAVITTRLGQTGFAIRDQVRNAAERVAESQMLYHINFGLSLLEPGAQLVAPVRRLAPCGDRDAQQLNEWSNYGPGKAGNQEEVYFLELANNEAGETQVVLKNAAADFGVGVKFNATQLPYFTLWKNLVGESEGLATGLEPGTNYPNRRSFEAEHGRVAVLQPGESRTYNLEINLLTDADAVAAGCDEVAELQSTVEPIVHTAPYLPWCMEYPTTVAVTSADSLKPNH